MTMLRPCHASAYRLLAEVLLYPEERDAPRLEALAAEVGQACPEWRGTLEPLVASRELASCDIYLETFEIGAKAPLYLGHYLFEEPANCRSAGICGRNGYMIQLKSLYRHFGLQLDSTEMPDYLPLLLEFLALTAEHPDQQRRRWMIERYILPALPALSKALKELNNVYSPAADILQHLIDEELAESSAPQADGVTAAAELVNETHR